MTTTALVLLAAVIAFAMLAETWLHIHLRRQTAKIEQRSASALRQLSFRRLIEDRRRAGPVQDTPGLPAGSVMNDFELPTFDARTITRSQWSKQGTSTEQSKRPNCGSQ